MITKEKLPAGLVAMTAALIVTSLPVEGRAQGRLEEARAAIRDTSTSSASSSSSSESDDDLDSEDYSESSHNARGRREGLSPLLAIFAPLAGLAWIPYFALEHTRAEGTFTSVGRFRSYPYERGAQGQMSVCWPARLLEAGEQDAAACAEDNGGEPAPEGSLFSLRFASEYAYDLNGVHRPTVFVHLDTGVRLGIAASWSHMMERLDDGQLDRMNVGDVNLFFRITQLRRVQVRVGLGWRFMLDVLGIENGFNYSMAFDLFPVRPLILSAGVDIGSLGHAFLFHGRVTVGANIGPVEIYLGYDAMLIGPVLFQGPLAGVRLWL